MRQPEPQPAAQPVRPAAPAEEPTRIVGAAQEEATRIIPPRAAEPAPGYAPVAEMDATRVVSRAPEQEATRVLPRQPEPVRPAKSFAPDEEMEKYGTRVVPSTPAAAPSRLQAEPLDEEDDCEEEDPVTASLRRSSAGCRLSPPSCVRASPCAASCILSS